MSTARTASHRRADVSEGLATLSLLIKIAQYIAESAGYKTRYAEAFDFASFVSMFLFGVSLVLWLRSSRKELEKVQGIADRVEEIKAELDRVDLAARYGAGPMYLIDLLRTKALAHGHAGGETLSDVMVRVYGRAAQDLHLLTHGGKDAVEFEEYHIVDKFLLNLMRTLPEGSVWLGATRLQSVEAWEEGTAEDSYFKFQELVQQRTTARTISYFRLWCFDNEARREQLVGVLKKQNEAGLTVRTCLSSDTPDSSIIWIPRTASARAQAPVDLDVLFPALLKRDQYEPLCAIIFKARGGKELDSMTLYAPNAERFDQLRRQFQRLWARATPVA